jgi:hypothetical protein
MWHFERAARRRAGRNDMASRATAPSQSKPEVESPERKQSAEEPTQITLDPSKIAAVAYGLWVARGRHHGTDQEDWFDAEFSLRSALEEELAKDI